MNVVGAYRLNDLVLSEETFLNYNAEDCSASTACKVIFKNRVRIPFIILRICSLFNIKKTEYSFVLIYTRNVNRHWNWNLVTNRYWWFSKLGRHRLFLSYIAERVLCGALNHWKSWKAGIVDSKLYQLNSIGYTVTQPICCVYMQ